MTTGTIESKKTRLFFLTSSGSPQQIHKVACPTGISGLGGPGTKIDTTCLDSEEEESRRGFKQPNALPIPINFIPRSASHQALLALEESGETVDWMVVMSDNPDGVPTEAAGLLVSPGPTSCRFQGYIVDIDVQAEVNNIVKAIVTIQRTGAKEWDLPDADLP